MNFTKFYLIYEEIVGTLVTLEISQTVYIYVSGYTERKVRRSQPPELIFIWFESKIKNMTKPLVHVDSWERNFRSRDPIIFLKLKKVVQIDFPQPWIPGLQRNPKTVGIAMPNCTLWDSICPVPEPFLCPFGVYIYIYIRFGSRNWFCTSHPLHAKCETYALDWGLCGILEAPRRRHRGNAETATFLCFKKVVQVGFRSAPAPRQHGL